MEHFMKKKQVLYCGQKTLSKDHRCLEMAIKHGLGNQFGRKTGENFWKALRMKLSEQWHELN